MSKLPEPINGTEQYLTAILCELRALRVAVEGGRQAAQTSTTSPAKRTRTRTRGAGT